jgi:hypothetical protein
MRTTGRMLAGCLFLAISTLAWAQSAPSTAGEFPLASRLPAGAMFYAGWAGQNPTFSSSPLGQMLNDPIVTAGTALATTALKANIPPEAQPIVDSALSIAGILNRCPVALTIIDLKPAGDPLQVPVFSAALIVDLGSNRQEFEQALAPLLAMMPPDMKTTVGDITTINGTPIMVSFGYLGNTFVLAIGDGTLGLIQGMTPAKSLMADPAFLNTMAAVGPAAAKGKTIANQAQVGAYIDAARLAKAISGMVHPTNSQAGGAMDAVTKAFRSLGLDKITTLAASVRVVDDGLYSRLRITSPAPHEGLLSLPAGLVSDADFAAIPPDAASASVIKISAANLFGRATQVVKTLSSDGGADFDKTLAEFKSNSGVSIPDDLLANIGDTWTCFSTISASGTDIGSVVISAKLKDAGKVSDAINKLEAYAAKSASTQPSPIKIVTVGQLQVHCVDLPASSRAKMQPLLASLQPAWCVSGNTLYLALTPQSLATAATSKPATSLAQNPGFIKARSHITGQPSILLYSDEAKTMSAFDISTLGAPPQLQMLQTMISSFTKGLSKYMQPAVDAVSVDKDGITMESFGTAPGGSTAIAGTAINAAILMPMLGRARESARGATSQAHLCAIAKGMGIYSASTNDQAPPPPDLQMLVKGGFVSPASLVSPLTGKTYAYIRLTNWIDLASPVVIAFDDPDIITAKGMPIPVLMSDYTVKTMDRKTFDAELTKSLKLMRAQGGKYFPPTDAPAGPASMGSPQTKPSKAPANPLDDVQF